jgi:hypothetical protein
MVNIYTLALYSSQLMYIVLLTVYFLWKCRARQDTCAVSPGYLRQDTCAVSPGYLRDRQSAIKKRIRQRELVMNAYGASLWQEDRPAGAFCHY